MYHRFGKGSRARLGRWHNTHLKARYGGKKRLMYVNGTTGQLAFRIRGANGILNYHVLSDTLQEKLQEIILLNF